MPFPKFVVGKGYGRSGNFEPGAIRRILIAGARYVLLISTAICSQASLIIEVFREAILETFIPDLLNAVGELLIYVVQ